MRMEVEIKAWVDDPAALRALLAGRYPHGGSFVKEDVYYRLPAAETHGAGSPRAIEAAQPSSGSSAIEFRLRVEEHESFVTAKRKTVVDGVEINEEIEFTVSEARAFEQFAGYLGAAVFARKRKVGDRYRAGEATIELAHVDRLGDFVEIERLIEEAGPAEIDAANRDVRSLLKEIGIGEDKIEPRYYIDMLAQLERSEASAEDR